MFLIKKKALRSWNEVLKSMDKWDAMTGSEAAGC
jgi:hypothetical protein